jgi:thymidylate kinase
MFVSFCGIDGAGKDSTARQLAVRLKERLGPQKVVLLRKEDRPDFLNGRAKSYMRSVTAAAFPHNPPRELPSLRDESLVLAAAAWYSSYHSHIVQPLLGKGKLVICTSWFDKLRARFELKGCDPRWIGQVFSAVPQPALTFFLPAPPRITVTRRHRFTPMECGAYDGYPPNKVGYLKYQGKVYKVLRSIALDEGYIVLGSEKSSNTIEELGNQAVICLEGMLDGLS